MHVANCGKKGNTAALEFLLNWTAPTGEKLVDRMGQQGKGESDQNYAYTGLGGFANVETVRLCLDAGADPNEQTEMTGLGKTMCKIARGVVSNLGSESFLMLALAGMEGARPLHTAVSNDNVAVVELLLERGADPRIQNKFGQTPLDIAQKRGQARISKLLKDALARLPALPEAPVKRWWQCGAEKGDEVFLPPAFPSDEVKIKRSSKDSCASTAEGSESGSDDPFASALYVSA